MATANQTFTLKRLGSSPYFQADFLEEEKNLLSSFGTFLEIDQKPKENTPQRLIYITNTHSRLESLNDFERENLALIVHPNSGHDHFSSQILNTIKAPVILGNSIRSHAVAEYILGALFSRFAMLPIHSNWSLDRKWERSLLQESKICLIGKGHIGSILEKVLTPLVKTLSIYDPYLDNKAYQKLDCQNADALILCAELNENNIHMIDQKFFAQLSSRAIVINAARGKLISMAHLKEFLLAHPQAFAILDVFENEPCDFSEVFKNVPNIQTTSHIAGVYSTIHKKTLQFEKSVIQDFIELDLKYFLTKYQTLHLQEKLNKWKNHQINSH